MDEHITAYSNNFRVLIGVTEAQLIFRLETPVIDDSTGSITGVSLQNVADIRLNPIMAKELCLALQQQLKSYESQFGPLADIACASANAED